jgi:O-antigen/teichoic acid export membrane protein
MLSILRKSAVSFGRSPSLIALADQGLVSFTNFATGVMIGRVCGRAELGVYALAWTLVVLATDFPTNLTTTPYAVYSPQLSRKRRRVYLGSILVHQLFISLILALMMAAAAHLASWQQGLPHDLSHVITITAYATVFIGLREFVRRVSFANLEVGIALLVDGVACVIQGAGLLLFLHFRVLNASQIYILLGFSSALVVGWWLAYHWDAFHVDARFCVRDIKRNWRFSRWVVGSWTIAAIATYVYPWLLAAFDGTSATGVWSACSTIVALGNPIYIGLGNYVGPQIHTAYGTSGAAAMQRSVYRSGLMLTGMLSPVVLVLLGGGNRIVTAVYGQAYSGSGGVVTLLAFSMLMTALMYPFSRGLFSLECAKADMLINAVSVALLFTVGIAVVKEFSVFGAAAMLLVSTALGAVIRIAVFAREIRRRTLEHSMSATLVAVESSD